MMDAHELAKLFSVVKRERELEQLKQVKTIDLTLDYARAPTRVESMLALRDLKP
jgi:hypothetical protein